MRKKKNALMLADTRPALVGTILKQIEQTNCGLFDEAIIYYIDPLSDRDRKLMSEVLPCRFIHYSPPLPRELFTKPRFAMFSPLMFARYEMFSYLDEFETITWLDTDILIQGDLSEMIKSARNTGAAFIREDPVNKTSKHPDRMRTCFNTEIGEFDTSRYLYCSGTIVLTDLLIDYSACTEWCYRKTVEWADILSLPDQGVLNAAIQQFDIHVTPLCGAKYCCYPYMNRECSDAVIIHAWGRNKFWNDWYIYNKYSNWGEYHKKWKEQGGSSLNFKIAPSVSVVIPAYKPKQKLLHQCLDSLMKQRRSEWERFSDFEIIIIAEPFEQDEIRTSVNSYNDPRIVLVFNEKRMGIAASLNKGMRMAQGRYIARMDDDDLAAPDRLYKQFEYMESHLEIDLCTTDFEYFGDMNERRVSFEGELARAWSIFTCPFDHPTIMLRKQFFYKNELFYDEKRGFVEDWELWRRAFSKGMKVGCIHEVLFYHRWLNSGSAGQTSKTVDMMREMIQDNFRELGVEIPVADLALIGPWNGRLTNEDDVNRVKQYFDEALMNNRVNSIYDQSCLKNVFNLRLQEIRTGVLPGLTIHLGENTTDLPRDYIDVQVSRNSKFKTFLKKLFKPLYKPFRHRYEDKIINIENCGWINEGHLMDCIHKLDAQDAKIVRLEKQLQTLESIIQGLSSQFDDSNEELVSRLQSNSQNICQELAAKMYIESENTRQEISARLYEIEKKSELIENLQLQQQRNRKKVFLIGTPEHSNIGDAAITVGEIEFLHRYYPAHEVVELPAYDMDKWYDKFTLMIQKDDIIFLHGGGNLGDYYVYEENIRRRVVQDFPMNQIVILPQTICFSDTERGKQELKISEEIYNAHNNLKLLTRGKQSLTFAQNHFKNVRCVNALDMALTIKFITNQTRYGILLCLRDLDDESGFQAEEYQSIIAAIKHADEHYEKTANIYRDNRESKIDMGIRKRVVYEELRKFAAREVIVTDRLHGLIFSIITKTPCVLLSSFNQKIPEFYEFFKDSNAIIYIDKDIHKLNDAINQAKRVKNAIYPVLTEDVFGNIHDFIEE